MDGNTQSSLTTLDHESDMITLPPLFLYSRRDRLAAIANRDLDFEYEYDFWCDQILSRILQIRYRVKSYGRPSVFYASCWRSFSLHHEFKS